MALKLIKVLVEMDFPSGLADDEQPVPPDGYESAHPIRELEQIIRDGCGSVYVYQVSYCTEPPVRDSADVIFTIEEV